MKFKNSHIYSLLLFILLSVTFSCLVYQTKGVKAKGEPTVGVIIFRQTWRGGVTRVPAFVQKAVVDLFKERKLKPTLIAFPKYDKLVKGRMTTEQRFNFLIPKFAKNYDYLCLIETSTERIKDTAGTYSRYCRVKTSFHRKTNKLIYKSRTESSRIYAESENLVENKTFIVFKNLVLEQIMKFIDKEFIDNKKN